MSHNEVLDLTKELRSAIESKNAESAEVKEKISKIESKLNSYEEKNAKLVADLAEKEKSILEAKELAENLEKKYTRMPRSDYVEAKQSPEYKAFEKFIRKGEKGFVNEPMEAKYLRTDSDPNGGYLAPEEYVNEIIKNITEISPVRQASRVRSTTRESIAIPRRTGLVQGGWIGEGGEFGQSESTYGIEEIKVNKLGVYTVITTEMLNDAAFNMEAEINQDMVEEFAKLEGEAFIKGNGINKPQGLLTNPNIQEVNTGIANDITADSIIEIAGELKTGYNPAYMLNRRTLARIRRLKTGDGQYLWQPGLAAGQPNMINGYPYFSAIDMDDIAVNSTPVLFGDFMRGYTIVDGTTLSVIRDSYFLATSGKVRFVAHRRVGGQVVLPEAIKKLKVSI